MIDVKTIFDSLEIRCPQLGGAVPFDYCRKSAEGRPCSRALICWEHAFPVADYMTRVMTREEWREIFEKPTPGRLNTILKAVDTVLR